MDEAEQHRVRSHEVQRLETFVDAIAAIAITLLVLPLVDLTTGLDGGSVTHLLDRHRPELGAFLLSFVIIARLWLGQHRVMRTVVADDRRVQVLLLLWSLTIVVLPFPTALVAESGSQAVTKVLYVGTMTLSSAVLALLATLIARTERLRAGGPAPDGAPAAGTVVAFLVALAVMVSWPASSYFPLLLLILVDPVVDRVRRRRTGGDARVRVGE